MNSSDAHSRTALPLAACRAFIFDMDGTLTVPQHDFDAIRAALDIPQGALILEHLDALPATAAREKRARLDAIELAIAAESRAAPGLFELLDTLRERDIAFAILTRNSAHNAKTSLRAIKAQAYFSNHLIIGRDEALPKPDPAGIKVLAARLGCAAHQCAMVGDYRHDLEAGSHAGCHTVHVRHANTAVWPAFTNTTVSSLTHLREELS